VALIHLAGDGCPNGISCPTLYALDGAAVPLDEVTVAVQGYTNYVGDELHVPAGEAVVTIPASVLLAAADKLRARS